MASGKLQECCPQRPIIYPGQNPINFADPRRGRGPAWWCWCSTPTPDWIVPIIAVLALAFGVLLIIPIGGADMPTVIALLNAYAGLSAAALGFVLDNKLLIVAGALDGASGLILAIIMCRAMNRSFRNVLFGAFGAVDAVEAGGGDAASRRRSARPTPDEAAEIMKIRPLGGDRPRLRHGRRAGAAQGARAGGRPGEGGRGGALRHPPGGRAHAGPHERAAGRGQRALRPAARHGRDQRDFPQTDVVLVLGRERRGQPRRAPRHRAARSTACRSSRWTRPPA